MLKNQNSVKTRGINRLLKSITGRKSKILGFCDGKKGISKSITGRKSKILGSCDGKRRDFKKYTK